MPIMLLGNSLVVSYRFLFENNLTSFVSMISQNSLNDPDSAN
jgi:hypothetical protein